MNQSPVWPTSQLFARQAMQILIDFDRQHGARLIGQPAGERPDARADLQHHVGLTEFRRPGNQVDEIQIDQEILAVMRDRPKARCGQSPRQVRGGLSWLIQSPRTGVRVCGSRIFNFFFAFRTLMTPRRGVDERPTIARRILPTHRSPS